MLRTLSKGVKGVLFANWLQSVIALKGNLKTFRLGRRKTNQWCTNGEVLLNLYHQRGILQRATSHKVSARSKLGQKSENLWPSCWLLFSQNVRSLWGSSLCKLTAIGHRPQRKSENFQARPKRNLKQRRESVKSPPWKRHLATSNFTEKSQLEAILLESWQSLTFLLVALPSKCKIIFGGVLFANWLQLVIALKGNLKTFRLGTQKRV